MLHHPIPPVLRYPNRFGEVLSASAASDASKSPPENGSFNVRDAISALKESVEKPEWKKRKVKPEQSVSYYKADGKDFRYYGKVESGSFFYYDTEPFQADDGSWYYEINQDKGVPQTPALYAKKSDVDGNSEDA